MKNKIRKYKGLPVIDATEDLNICITKKDISKSEKNNPSQCAASIATQRILRTEVDVHIARVYVKNKAKNCWVRFLTPHSIGREITSFDRSGIFEPGEYTIKAPSVSQRLGCYKSTKHSNTKTGKRLLGKRHVTTNIRESAK